MSINYASNRTASFEAKNKYRSGFSDSHRQFPHPVTGYRFITDRNTYLALLGAGTPSQAIKVPLNIILTDRSTFKKSRKPSLPCCLTTRTSLPRPFRVPRARRVTASCAILVTLFQTKFVIILWFTPCTLRSGDFFSLKIFNWVALCSSVAPDCVSFSLAITVAVRNIECNGAVQFTSSSSADIQRPCRYAGLRH